MAASVAFAARPPRPRSRGPCSTAAAGAAPPPFPSRPPRPASPARASPADEEPSAPPPPAIRRMMPMPPDLDFDVAWRVGHSGLGTCSSHSSAEPRRRAASAFPPTLEPLMEEPQEPTWRSSSACSSLPIIHNLANFDRPQAYRASLKEVPGVPVRRSMSQASGSSKSSARSNASGRGIARRPAPSPIDQAIQRELIGDGIALEEVVANKKNSGWAVKQRTAQRGDLGHCCHGCRQPLRGLNEEVTVWTGAAIYRRFHPACAANYVLRAGAEGGASGSQDIVEGYADGWRAPRESGAARPVEAARQWLLSQDQGRNWGSLRGDLFTTVTVTENGKKKAVPGLSHEQMRLLQTKHRWHGCEGEDQEHGECEDPDECAVCFSALDAKGPLCVRLPCAPQHIFHLGCVQPWLRKASLCPTCRRDIRPLLQEKR
eukprot:TRINITY_DN60350_c0_g1_i1.p1 TRINITY_DN60350_c0_g1~~TRINITY_DN60350_c0_g1_i1.p1  ORF type:complete len:430 (-),score=56.48 TRINITY_DN60350_c0_g1_i1:340-1629(-)